MSKQCTLSISNVPSRRNAQCRESGLRVTGLVSTLLQHSIIEEEEEDKESDKLRIANVFHMAFFQRGLHDFTEHSIL